MSFLQKIRINTDLEKDIVLARIAAELVPNKLINIQSRLEGQATINQIVVSYRSSVFFFRQLKIATFRGRIIKLGDGSMIEGNIESDAFYSASIGALFLVIAISLVNSIVSGNYFDVLSIVGGSVVCYLIMQWYYKSNCRCIVDCLYKAAKITE